VAEATIPNQGRDDFLADLLLSVGFGEGVRYDHLHSRWLVWGGVRWRPDRQRLIYDRMRQCAVALWAASSDEEGSKRKMLSTLFDTGRKEGVLKSLSAREGIAMAGTEWDRDPYLLGFENGVLDLRTRTFDAHPTPDLLISKSVGADWDESATCPIFAKFIQDILSHDDDLIRYVLHLLGYSLFGLQSEQKFWMWVGRGSNGKGVLARTMLRAMGDYADAPSDTLYMRTRFGSARSDAARPDLLRLQSVRFTAMSEPPGGQFNEEMLKAHTGEDVILARDLYGKSDQMATFPPTHKIIFLTNDPPKTDDVGISMRRRARVVRFEEDYTGPNADMTIEDRMKEEQAGILRVLSIYAMQWWNGGDPGLAEPVKVTAWSTEYIEENDPLAGFVQECCLVARHMVGSSALLWASYEDWAARRSAEPMSRTGFGLALGRRFKKGHRETGTVFFGVKAKSAVEMSDGDDGDDGN